MYVSNIETLFYQEWIITFFWTRTTKWSIKKSAHQKTKRFGTKSEYAKKQQFNISTLNQWVLTAVTKYPGTWLIFVDWRMQN